MGGYDDADDPEETWGEGEGEGGEPVLDSVRLIGRFARHAAGLPWFAHLGETIPRDTRDIAETYLAGLGFPDVALVPVRNWREAALAAETRDYDAPGFEAEEQLRAGLTATAVELYGEDTVEIALAHVAAETGRIIREHARNAALTWGQRPVKIVTVAAGSASQSCHQAALLILAGLADEDHPFARKFALFEQGRWPIGITGMSFNLF
ncbi:MAG: hypothetical protein HXY22_06050 [Alphaproteobacteria bacterium]|nr:hypothetical protein [Alphaproteobacteria bacterium]